ncbi:MAG: DUF4177 domain-containing protein [Pseudooceanicola sp.]|nr:DUF4177 domain-containing protein [Pseudooceanicola sp.]
MTRYEYKVVPAPSRGTKAKGVRSPEGRFAVSIEAVLNEMGAQGWEYLRAELLPSEERQGLTGSTTNWRNMLVFRRALAEGAVHVPASQVADTGLPPLGGAERSAPALVAAAQAEPIYARPREEQPTRPTPPLVATRTEVEKEDEDPDPGKGPMTGIEKVMRFTARKKTD